MSDLRKGFCPTLWTPMASGDGLIVRIRTGARALHSRELLAIADVAETCGNGQIELTRRGNVQLRGLREDTVPVAQAELVRLGLGEPSAELEHRLSILVDPLVGIDPARAGVGALVSGIEQALRDAGPLPNLPAKFGVVVESSDATLAEVRADIRVQVDAASATVAGVRTPLSEVPSAVVGLARQVSGLSGRPRASALPEPARWIGYQDHPVPLLGMGIPFGSTTAAVWRVIAGWLDRFGRGVCRITASRALLIPLATSGSAQALVRVATEQGLITSAQDPLLRVDACPGAPTCSSALGETRALARTLSAALVRGATLHVSGCSKGCARSGASDCCVVSAADGCRLAYAADSVTAAASEPVPLAAAEARLRAWPLRAEARAS